MSDVAPFAGTRILLGIAPATQAMAIESALVSRGAHVLGPYRDAADARGAAATIGVDAAFLDFPDTVPDARMLASILARRGVPVVCAGNAGADGDTCRVLERPYVLSAVLDALERLLPGGVDAPRTGGREVPLMVEAGGTGAVAAG